MSVSDAWTRLELNGAAASGRSLSGLFGAEPERLQRLSFSAGGLDLDLSKQAWSLADFDQALTLALA